MASSVDGVLASIDQVQSLSPDDFTRVIEHWKRHAAKLWAGPLQQLPMHGPAPPPQTSGIGVGVSVIQVSFLMQTNSHSARLCLSQGKEGEVNNRVEMTTPGLRLTDCVIFTWIRPAKMHHQRPQTRITTLQSSCPLFQFQHPSQYPAHP